LNGCAETQWVGQTGIVEGNYKTIGVYPNPAVDVLKYRTDEVGSVEIIDAIGRTVLSGTATLGQNQIDVSSLPKGAYILKFEGESFGTSRFIKE
jgi:hypothetical protein